MCTIDALFGKTRQAILALFFGHTDETFFVRQIIRTVNAGQGTVQRELRALANAGVLKRIRRGNQIYYQADSSCPYFEELRGLVLKTSGLSDVLRSALAPLLDRIVASFVYGSMANSLERSGSDIDLMVIGDVAFKEVVEALGSAQETLGREINPTVYGQAEFKEKLSSGHHFLTRIAESEKVMLIGALDVLG